MNIWIIVLGEPIPLDAGNKRMHRSGMLSQEFIKRGHAVTFWTSNVDHFTKTQRCSKTRVTDINDKYKIIELSGKLYKKNISISRIIHNIQVTREFKRNAINEKNPDLIICNYPTIELAEAAVTFGKKNNIPTIVDIRDFWPDIFYETLPSKLAFIGDILFYPWEKKARNIIKNVNAVTGISDEAIEWGRKKINETMQSCDQAFHLAYEKTDDFLFTNDFLEKNDINIKKHQIYCFFGNLSKRIELKTLTSAAKILHRKGFNNIRIVVCGSGEMLEYLVKDSEDCPLVILPGWIDKDEINTLLAVSKGGILPYPSSLDFIRSYPNKVGEYLSHNLPILSSVQGAMEALISNWKCGITYENNSPQSLVDAIEFLEKNEDARANMAINAEECFKKKFDSKIVYSDYVSFAESFKYSNE